MAKNKYRDWLTKSGLNKLRKWAKKGLTDEQIASNAGISRSTLNEWKRKYPDIADALKSGKEIADEAVENALYQKAIGMEVTDTQYKMVKVDAVKLKAQRTKFMNRYKLDHPEASEKDILLAAAEEVPTYERIPILKIKKQLPPDATAAMFWLKNRKPEVYRDQTFRELNLAQVEKAKAEARIAQARADEYDTNFDAEDRTTIIDDLGDDSDGE